MHESNTKPPKRLLRTREVAEYYSVQKLAVFSWVKRGCPVVRLPGEFRFDPDAVAEWLRSIAQ